jgi:ATP-grasp domain
VVGAALDRFDAIDMLYNNPGGHFSAPAEEISDNGGLLLSLRAAPLLRGARGRPARDLEAAAAVVAAVSRVAAAHPEIAEIEVNPLLALPDGALGLDASVVRAEPAA